MKVVSIIFGFVIGSMVLSSCSITGYAVGGLVHKGVKPVTVLLNNTDSVDLRKADKIKVHFKPDKAKERNELVLKGYFYGLEKTEWQTVMHFKRQGAIQEIDIDHIATIQHVNSKGERIGMLVGGLVDLTVGWIYVLHNTPINWEIPNRSGG